jgi:hypothetical protein
MTQIPRIEPKKLSTLIVEINALDRLPPSLEIVERMVKLIANRFCVPITATYRVHGKPPNCITYLDFEWGRPANMMNVRLEGNGYHCFHQFCADRYDRLETATSLVAWYYFIGRPYPLIGRYNLLNQ